MWLFGILETIIPDPLFAGRFVSVLFGLITFFGIYILAKDIFNRKIAVFSAFLYMIIPLFVFYDRQALMESGVSAVSIWAVYFLIKFIKNNLRNDAILLGIALGLGFFIKTNFLIFIASAVFLLLFFLFKKIKISWENFSYVLGSILLVDLLLL